MKSFHVLFIALGIIGIIILYVIWNIGLLKPVIIEQMETPQIQVLFKKHQGPYHDVGKVFEDVENTLAKLSIKCDQTFGRYYDDPNEVEPERTRADIGCVVQNTNTLPTSEGLEAETIEPYLAMIGIFEGAPWLTAFKVYKTLKKESYQRNLMIDNDSPVFETYEKTPTGFRTKVFFRIKR